MRRSPSSVALGFYGAVGAVAPDVLILYSKRLTMPSFTFDVWQYAVATLLYVGLAAIVAIIFPYGRNRTEWKAFAVGFTLPILLAGLAASARGEIVNPRGSLIPGTLLDLLSLW